MLFEITDETLKKKKRILAIGDLHGDYQSFKSVLEMADLNEDLLVFLGDYADRGDHGVEIIEKLHSYLVKYPEDVIALKGNHEIYSESGTPHFNPCDLIEEAETKRGGWQSFFEKEFKPFFSRLYLAARIPGKVLFIHAGITDAVSSPKDLSSPSPELENDLLWSDAVEAGVYERFNVLRGTGKMFGEELTMKVCERLNVKRIIRSHEPRKAMKGPYYEHHDQVITVNSTSVYGGRPHILELSEKAEKISAIYL